MFSESHLQGLKAMKKGRRTGEPARIRTRTNPGTLNYRQDRGLDAEEMQNIRLQVTKEHQEGKNVGRDNS